MVYLLLFVTAKNMQKFRSVAPQLCWLQRLKVAFQRSLQKQLKLMIQTTSLGTSVQDTPHLSVRLIEEQVIFLANPGNVYLQRVTHPSTNVAIWRALRKFSPTD